MKNSVVFYRRVAAVAASSQFNRERQDNESQGIQRSQGNCQEGDTDGAENTQRMHERLAESRVQVRCELEELT